MGHELKRSNSHREGIQCSSKWTVWGNLWEVKWWQPFLEIMKLKMNLICFLSCKNTGLSCIAASLSQRVSAMLIFFVSSSLFYKVAKKHNLCFGFFTHIFVVTRLNHMQRKLVFSYQKYKHLVGNKWHCTNHVHSKCLHECNTREHLSPPLDG